MKNKKMVSYLVIVAVVFLAVGYYSGVKHGQAQNVAGNSASNNFGQGKGGMRAGRIGGGFVNGDIISKDDKSITVSLRNGGSQIIFVSPSTEVMKSVSGTASDLTVGKSVSINGTPNSDGSVSAQSIQIRPAQTNPNK